MVVWQLTEDRRGVAFEPDRDLVEPPLTRAERVIFAREIGERREGLRDAYEMHLHDLHRPYPEGLPAEMNFRPTMRQLETIAEMDSARATPAAMASAVRDAMVRPHIA